MSKGKEQESERERERVRSGERVKCMEVRECKREGVRFDRRVLQHMTSKAKHQKESSVLRNAQLCVDGLLLHDFHDGGAGLGTAVRSGVDGNGLLCRTCVFLPVDVDSVWRF